MRNDSEATVVEASAEAEDGWVDTIRSLARNNLQFLQDSTPGYYNNEGMPEQSAGLAAGQYGGGPVAFFNLIRDWREEGNLVGLNIT